MLTIGLLGGMGWESSVEYYKALNRGVEERLGGLHSAKCLMSSVEFAELTELQQAERWGEVSQLLVGEARKLEAAGADLLLMCTTAFHLVADDVAGAVDVPVLHLADVVAEAVKGRGLTSVGLIATEFTMRRDFFTDRLASHGLQVLTPREEHHGEVDRIIYEELVHGRVVDASRGRVVSVIDELWDAGAEGVILGCTELELLVKQADADVPVFPSTTLHVAAALDRALS